MEAGRINSEAAFRPRVHGTVHAWPVWGALAVGVGTAAQLQQVALWPRAHYGAWLLAALALVCAAMLVRRGRSRAAASSVAVLVAAAIAVAAFAATGWRAQERMAQRLAPALEGRDLVVTDVVPELPRQLADGVRFVFDVDDARAEGQAVRLPPRVSLGWYRGFSDDQRLGEPSAAVRAGQRWQFTVRLKQVHGTLNPHGFDYERWALEQHIGAVGYVRATERQPARLLAANLGSPIERARQGIADAIARRVSDERVAGVLAALTVGDQAAIERSDWDLFRDTGVAHLMSISGLHVTMFAWLAGAVLGWLWRRSPRAMHWLPALLAARWGGLVAAAAYALLAGWGVPAQRTVWMIAVAVCLASSGLRWPAPWVLLAAGLVVTVMDPWSLLQPGFWLSFVAVGLLVVTSAPAQGPALGDAPPPTWPMRLARTVRTALHTQWVATLGLAPLTLVFFQQVSLVGLLANLVAIPVVTLLVTPLALLGALWWPLWSAASAVVHTMVTVLDVMAQWPWAVWVAPAAPWWAHVAGLAGGALVVMPLPWVLRAMGLALVAPLVWPAPPTPPHGAMHVTVADVGQGSAIVVRTQHHVLLHDTGAQYSRDSDAGTRVLLPLLRSQGWTPVDMLMLSHRDTDHVGGAPALLAGVPVRSIVSSLEDTHPLHQAQPPHTRCEAGQSWQWDGVRFEVLHPTAQDYAVSTLKPNALSCVLRVRDAAGRSLLLTGDIEAEQEARLVRTHGTALQSDVLLVPHHGSRTSSTAAFVAAVSPQVAVVQAGYRNRFGHPAPDVLARYATLGVALRRTDQCGAWQWRSDGPEPTLGTCERESSPRYWHWRPSASPTVGLDPSTTEVAR